MSPTRLLINALAAFAALAAPATSSVVGHGDDCKGTWQDLGPIPVRARQEHTAVALNSTTIALVGGIFATDGGGADPENLTDWTTTDMFQLYNTKTRAWELGPPVPVKYNHPNVAVHDGKVYVLGGLETDPESGGWFAAGGSFVYDPRSANKSWRALAPSPEGLARGSAAVGVSHRRGHIFLAGGVQSLYPTTTIGSVLAYDIASDSWLTLPPAAATMPGRRDHAGAAVVDGTLYVVGGREDRQEHVRDTVFALDLDRPSSGWSTRRGRMPTPRGGVAAAAVGGRIYTFSGEGNPANGTNGVFDDTEVYDVRADKWTVLGPMAFPRHGGWAVAVNGGVYLTGGGTVQGGSATTKFDVFWPPPKKCSW